ncbi:MAG: hypothetical protein IANPNBLG_00503 [Bryobacteraceae bacterium]|nr:hypothetical protein [Bryobacteraceae bacterium]
MLLEQGEGVVPGFAGVNDNGFPRPARQAQLVFENRALRLTGREIVMVIQADLTDGHHLRMREQSLQGGKCRESGFGGIMRMDAHGGVDGLVTVRQADGGIEDGRPVPGADSQQSAHSRRPRPLDDGFPVIVELLAIEVAVGVHQAHFRRAPTGTSSRKAASTGEPPSREAATIMPCEVSPRSFRGSRLAAITTLRPIN